MVNISSNKKVDSSNWIIRNNNQVKREAAVKVSLSTSSLLTRQIVRIEEVSNTKLVCY